MELTLVINIKRN